MVPNPGLEGVVVAETNISLVDGLNGKLVYRGHWAKDLAIPIRLKKWPTCSGMDFCRITQSSTVWPNPLRSTVFWMPTRSSCCINCQENWIS
jgi:Citrate synthase